MYQRLIYPDFLRAFPGHSDYNRFTWVLQAIAQQDTTWTVQQTHVRAAQKATIKIRSGRKPVSNVTQRRRQKRKDQTQNLIVNVSKWSL
jgi:hypothetical protein